MKPLTKGWIGEVTRLLAADFQPEMVWLFGSHAWATGQGSDLDLMMVVSESSEPFVRRAQRAHRELIPT